MRYAHAFAIQACHTTLANAQGKIEERLARWLPMAQDRVSGNELQLTHEFLAVMLGVRRTGVTTALHELEGRGLISTARGSVAILDRDGLEEGANSLYGVPEAEFDRLFSVRVRLYGLERLGDCRDLRRSGSGASSKRQLPRIGRPPGGNPAELHRVPALPSINPTEPERGSLTCRDRASYRFDQLESLRRFSGQL
jgi:hypothetical protein